MKEVSDTELKKIQIEILQHVDAFCHQNNIVYSIAYGTLIGAVRHKGYIPWDDDIDIVMTRSEYNRFLTLYEKEDRSQYKVYNFNTNSQCTIPFTKIFDNETLWIELVENPVHIGINIDVFPLDRMPDDGRYLKVVKKVEFFKNILMLKQVSISTGRNPVKNLILRLAHFVLKKVSISKMVRIINNVGLTYKNESFEKYANVVWTAYGNRDYVYGKDITRVVRLPFENVEFDAYVGYDTWLHTIFNDYMQLPPIEKRVTHHAFKAYRKCDNKKKR